MLVDDDKADDTADAEGCEPNVRIQHLNVGDDHAASSASDSNNGVLEIVGVHGVTKGLPAQQQEQEPLTGQSEPAQTIQPTFYLLRMTRSIQGLDPSSTDRKA